MSCWLFISYTFISKGFELNRPVMGCKKNIIKLLLVVFNVIAVVSFISNIIDIFLHWLFS